MMIKGQIQVKKMSFLGLFVLLTIPFIFFTLQIVSTMSAVEQNQVINTEK